jgi:hypothetical protein
MHLKCERLLLALLCLTWATSSVEAKRPPCSSKEVAIADERGGKLCMKKSEVTKAKKICAKLGRDQGKKISWVQCTCQDGDSVAACGN